MSTVKANDLTNVTGGIPTVKSQRLIPTAWVNFNGSGTVAINDDEGVSSLTDSGTGAYSVNLSNAMSDTNYCVASSNNDWNATAAAYPESTSKVKVYVENHNSLSDTSVIGVIVMGGQA
tara:strand:- start:5 stop:361 length:357 start_codon:yes stop_codon:yes gene_type:complete